MRELAMRPVDRTPGLDQIEDRLLLARQQPDAPRRRRDRGPRACPVSRSRWPASGARGRRRGRAPGTLWRAPTRPRRRRRSAPAARAWSPRSRARDRAEKPERCLPRCNESARPPTPSAPPRADRSPPSASSNSDLLGRRHPPRLRCRERGQRRVLGQLPDPDHRAHVHAPLSGCVGLRELLRADLQEHLPLLLRRQLPTLARLAVLHHHVLLVRGPHSLPELV